MMKKLVLCLAMVGLMLATTTIGYATTVSKILTGDYIGKTTSVQGRITEHFGGDFYRLVDYNGDFIRVNLAGMGIVNANHDLTVEGVISTRDNVLTLEATKVMYNQEAINNENNNKNADHITVKKILTNADKYMDQRVALEGRLTENMGDDYAMFYDNKGEHIVVKMNGKYISKNAKVIIYGVPTIANNRLEFILESFEKK